MNLRVSLLLVAALSVASTASAADRKTYHAASCHPLASFGMGAESTQVDRSVITGITAMSDNVYLTCPLIRDRIFSSTSLSSVGIEGYSNGGDFYCFLESQAEDDGGAFFDSDQWNTLVSGPVNVALSVDSSNGNQGTYAVGCHLATFGSSLYHVSVTESTSATE